LLGFCLGMFVFDLDLRIRTRIRLAQGLRMEKFVVFKSSSCGQKRNRESVWRVSERESNS